jgi:hypothetical protein
MSGRNSDPQDNRPPSSRGAHEAGMSEYGYDEGLGGVQAAETMLDIVRRLLEHEAGHPLVGEEVAELSERVCQKLRSHLVNILGTSGYHLFIVRAAATAETNSKLVVDADSRLKGQGMSVLSSSHQAAVETTLARFLDLMEDLVGQNLVLRLIHQAWPEFVLLPPYLSQK